MLRFDRVVSNPVFRGVITYSFAGLLGKSAPILLLPILTRYMTPADYGVVASVSAMYVLSMIMIESGSGNHIAAKFFAVPDSRNETRLEACAFAGLGAVAVFLFWGTFSVIGNWWVGIPAYWFFVVVTAAFFRVLLDHKLLVMNFRGDTLAFGVSQVLIALAESFFSILFVVILEWGWEGRAFAMVGVATIGGIWAAKDLIPHWRLFANILPGLARRWLEGRNIVVHGVANWTMTALDRYLIVVLDSAENAGVYAVSVQLVSVLAIVSGAFSQVWSRYLFSALAADGRDSRIQIVSWTYWSAVLWMVFCALFLLFAPDVVRFIVGARFAGVEAFFPYLVGQSFFFGLYVLVCGYFFARGATGLLATFTVASGLVCLAIDLVLIPFYGAVGAAIGGLIASVTYFFLVWVGSFFVQPMPWFGRRKMK